MDSAKFARYAGVLQESAVFANMSAAQLEQVGEQAMLLDAKPGDVILFENMRGGIGLYVILSGRVDILRRGEATQTPPQETHLATLGPGDCLGEYSLFDGQETSACARALQDTVLFFLPRGSFMRLVEGSPEIGKSMYHNLLVYLIRRLRQKDRHTAAKVDSG